MVVVVCVCVCLFQVDEPQWYISSELFSCPSTMKTSDAATLYSNMPYTEEV